MSQTVIHSTLTTDGFQFQLPQTGYFCPSETYFKCTYTGDDEELTPEEESECRGMFELYKGLHSGLHNGNCISRPDRKKKHKNKKSKKRLNFPCHSIT
jgi:hypothetical protein